MTSPSKVDRILVSLPATSVEVAAMLDHTPRRTNALLCYLRRRGLVRMTDRVGQRYAVTGPRPRIWERV